jgi:hypothetical protein
MSDTVRWIVDSSGRGGEASSEKCEGQFCLPFIEAWRKNQQWLCEGQQGGASGESKIAAYPFIFPQVRSQGLV